MASISILTLMAASGTTLAQYNNESPRNLVRLADRSADMKTDLSKAISLAEKHTGGVAVGVRLTTDSETFHMDANGLRTNKDNARNENNRNPDRDNEYNRNRDRDNENNPARDRDGDTQAERKQNQRQTNTPDARTKNLSKNSDEPMLAIVTCVIDQVKIRDVVIDMSKGTVLGMQSVNASGERMRRENQSDSGYYDAQFGMARASDLINATARNAQGQRLGDIEDLVINPETNRIVYGVLRRGGFLGFNESQYAISNEQLSVPKDGQIVLNLNEGDFENQPGFEDDNWPTQADPAWNTRRNQDTDTRRNQDTQKMSRTAQILKATDLIGTDVQSSDGKEVGEINDLVVEPRNGRVVYCIVDTDRGEIVVPMSVLQQRGKARVLELTSTEIMALPTIESGSDPDWNDAKWNQQVHDSYNAEMNLTEAPTGDDQP